MRISVLLASVAFFAVATAAPVPVEAKAVELIVNGSFEEGPAVEVYLSLDVKSTDIKGWTVTRGQIDYIGTNWPAADGKRSIDLHGSPGYGGIKQTIKTEKGKTYRVTFMMSSSPNGKPNTKALTLSANEQSKKFEASGKTYADMDWQKKTWDFKADAAETVIEFATAEKEDPNCGAAIDAVSVKLCK